MIGNRHTTIAIEIADLFFNRDRDFGNRANALTLREFSICDTQYIDFHHITCLSKE